MFSADRVLDRKHLHRARGVPYEEFMDNRLFKPLGKRQSVNVTMVLFQLRRPAHAEHCAAVAVGRVVAEDAAGPFRTRTVIEIHLAVAMRQSGQRNSAAQAERHAEQVRRNRQVRPSTAGPVPACPASGRDA
jgi:CubicO group peptidase (beta-lactamase class C family)